MKKKMCLIMAVLCLSGCGMRKENFDRENSDSANNTNTNVNWQEIYLNAFIDGKFKDANNMKIQFIDKDFDNIPELYYEYVAPSSEEYQNSKGNEDGLSLYIGSAKIYGEAEKYVSISDSGETTGENQEGYRFTFVKLLKTDEYVWGYQSGMGEMRLQSRKEDKSYNANPQRGLETGKGEIIFEPLGIYTPDPISVNPSNIDEEFEKGFNKAVANYVPNEIILQKIEKKSDGSDWADVYYEEITKKKLIVPL